MNEAPDPRSSPVVVVGFIFNKEMSKVLLIEREKPAWQAGKLNGIGGHLEKGETIHQCMVRECKEETGLETTVTDWIHFAILNRDTTGEGVEYTVHCFRTILPHSDMYGALPEGWKERKLVVANPLTLRDPAFTDVTVDGLSVLITVAMELARIPYSLQASIGGAMTEPKEADGKYLDCAVCHTSIPSHARCGDQYVMCPDCYTVHTVLKDHAKNVAAVMSFNGYTVQARSNRFGKPKRNDPCPCKSGKKYKACCGGGQ